MSISGQDLFSDLTNKIALLDRALGEFGSRGRTYAKAEQDYRQAIAKKILVERDNKTPVTIMSDICRGDTEIARLKFERDVSEVTYKAAAEAIQVYKIQIRVLENTIEREYRG